VEEDLLESSSEDSGRSQLSAVDESQCEDECDSLALPDAGSFYEDLQESAEHFRTSSPINFDSDTQDASGNETSGDSSTESLYSGAGVSVGEFQRRFIGIASNLRLTDKAAGEMLRLFSEVLPMPNRCPSLYDINQARDTDCEYVMQVNFDHGTCYILDMESQLERIICKYPSIFHSYNRTDGIYQDLTCGSVFAQRADTISKKHIYIILNADGVKTPQSSKGYQLWPLSFTIVNLPPKERRRYENVGLLSVFYGKHKPDAQKFLQAVIENTNGLKFSVGDINIELVVTAFVADFPAKASFLNMISFNGKFGCSLCLIEGVYSREHHKMTFPFEDHPSNLRNSILHEEHSKLGTTKSPFLGVKGPTLLSQLVQVPEGIPLDIMHLVYLNVMRKMLMFGAKHRYFNVKKSPRYRKHQ
jgi:hypothetical protein